MTTLGSTWFKTTNRKKYVLEEHHEPLKTLIGVEKTSENLKEE